MTCRRFFRWVVRRPLLSLVVPLMLVAFSGAGLGKLVKDTSIEAFMPAGHPALVADELASDMFGEADPLAIAIERQDGDTVFEPNALLLIAALSYELSALPNVLPDDVTSLATESAIFGEQGSVYVEPYIDPSEPGRTDGVTSESRWRGMLPHVDTLVSADPDRSAALFEHGACRIANGCCRRVCAALRDRNALVTVVQMRLSSTKRSPPA